MHKKPRLLQSETGIFAISFMATYWFGLAHFHFSQPLIIESFWSQGTTSGRA